MFSCECETTYSECYPSADRVMAAMPEVIAKPFDIHQLITLAIAWPYHRTFVPALTPQWLPGAAMHWCARIISILLAKPAISPSGPPR
jgi:hypothetical protein